MKSLCRKGLFFSTVVLFVVALSAAFLTPAPLSAQESSDCILEPGGDGAELAIHNQTCRVPAGTYHYGIVYIYDGGALTFDDARIDFWAKSILVENTGSLIAGTPEDPIGKKGGVVTIHLYGPNNGVGGDRIPCKSDAQCGIPSPTWTSSAKVCLPPGDPSQVTADTCKQSGGIFDYFYRYDTHGSFSTKDDFFGYKALAVSYGGTLRLFGKKGATYKGYNPSNCNAEDALQSCSSWVRLNKTLKPGDTQLTLARPVDWEKDDRIVVTTTDYLPGHSEQLQITEKISDTVFEINRIDPATNKIDTGKGVQYIHNGEPYPLDISGIDRLGLAITVDGKPAAETRAAVALLTRSIRIVSAGDTYDKPTCDYDCFPTPSDKDVQTAHPYAFGGHTLVRQGVKQYQIQGVEFYQLGQGGQIGNYPVHFHMARQTPPDTFVKDASVHDSMTRWYTIHATHNVTLQRNVGYLSIGHGYFLEDGTEINNQLLANLGIYARSASEISGTEAQPHNPRHVPGILSAPSGAAFPYQSDWVHPSVFWIMNGWNDFKGNMAAGAGACGACYWPVNGAISGPSQNEIWESYASIQKGVDRAGTAPLKTFSGNSCTTAMNAFNSTTDQGSCHGVLDSPVRLQQVPNKLAPDVTSSEGKLYYPIVQSLPAYTRCDSTGDCSSVAKCSLNNRASCMVAVLDHFTSSFNWAAKNFSAVWLRPRWFLLLNSVLTDVQQAALTFVTGGDYTHSSVIQGNWMLARKNVFIGHTQEQAIPGCKLKPEQTCTSDADCQNNTGPCINNANQANPYASNAGPFNPLTATFQNNAITLKGLACDNTDTNYCLSKAEGISMQLDGWGMNQRFFNIYDGPSLQDSNAYLDITRTGITDVSTKCQGANPPPECCPFPNSAQQCNNSPWMYGRVLGIPGHYPDRTKGQCYLPNAAIAWKQPNGFYYPPAFHSTNLFFHDVDIRHYVIEPQFLPEGTSICVKEPTKTCKTNADCQGRQKVCEFRPSQTCESQAICDQYNAGKCQLPDTGPCQAPARQWFQTDAGRVKALYCTWNDKSFSGFTAIDRQTILNDDDGSLTGLVSAEKECKLQPTQTCTSDADCQNNTGPCIAKGTVSVNLDPFFDAPISAPECDSEDTATTSPYEHVTTVVYPGCARDGSCADWSEECGNEACYGVPLYRQFLTNEEKNKPSKIPDTTKIRMMGPKISGRINLTANHGTYYISTTDSPAQQAAAGLRNIFEAGKTYYVFLVFGKPDTKQKYQLYVGKTGFDKLSVQGVQVNLTDLHLTFRDAKDDNGAPWPKAQDIQYDADGILTVTLDLSSFKKKFETATADSCQPQTFCEWKKVGTDTTEFCHCSTQLQTDNPALFKECTGGKQADLSGPDPICQWAVKDVDCPKDGCLGFRVTLGSGFQADGLNHRPITRDPKDMCFPKNADWNTGFINAAKPLAGTCFDPGLNPRAFCETR